MHLVTQSDADTCVKQDEMLVQVQQAFAGTRVAFTWELDATSGFHARSILTDLGWKISLDRGLDVWQPFPSGTFSSAVWIPELRAIRATEISYIRI